ncbi:MAG TPA: CHASE3 domain-containing protein [Bryobacteraceae bacterium]|nr:CHASE3 domain-containing protein [Bryobacteraceae bacterium]
MKINRGRGSRIPEMLVLGLSLLVVLTIVVLSYRSGQAARFAEEQRKISQDIERLNATLLSTLKDAETGQRGFLLTGQEQYLEPHNQAVSAIPGLLERLRAAALSRPDQAARIRNIQPAAAEKLGEMKTTIELRRSNRLAEAMALVDSNHGKTLMDQIRARCADIAQAAEEQSARFDAEATQSARNLRRVSTGGGVLLLLFLAFSTITIFRGMRRRDELFSQAHAGEKLLAATLSGIADGVIATDAQGRITFINPVAERLTGWNEQDALGIAITQVFLIVNETTRLKVDNPVEKALLDGMAVGLANHTNLISRSGQEIPIDDSAAPLNDENGNLVGAVLVFRDISARRLAEQRLVNTKEELQLFVDTAAHDLRSPLSSVSAMAELLAQKYQGQLGSDGQELIGFIGKGIDRVRNLLEDLLAFAQASHFDETAAPLISLEGPFQAALENLKTEIEKSAAAVTSSGLPVVAMQEAHALLLFQNLVGNAIKYCGGKTPCIHVRAEQNHRSWLLAVSDNGIGIERQYTEQIFKPFKRLHGDDCPGTGIGLAICQKIVNRYGGRIWVESDGREGSTFHFTIPRREDR